MVTLRHAALAAGLVCATGLGTPVYAQVTADVDLDVGGVKYEGFLGSAAAALTPTVRYQSRTLTGALQGSYLIYESGRTLVQGAAAAAWLAPPVGPVRAELSGFAGVSTYADAPALSHGLGRVRLHVATSRRGAWAGGGIGGLAGGGFETRASELGIGGWLTVPGGFLSVSGTLSSAADSSYADVTFGAQLSSGQITLEGVGGLRPWTQVGDRGAFVDVAVRVAVTPTLAAQLKGGDYLADPLRGGVAGRYVSAGVRFSPWGADRARPVPVSERRLRDARLLPAGASASAVLSMRAAAGGMYELRIRASAGVVEIAADFTDWQPVALENVGGGDWRLTVPLAPGLYRLNVRLDGGPWLVPAGATPTPDEFGGTVGLVVVRSPGGS